ncbi:MAG: HlyD family efflux transporter periplasmic adaptor subunit, partial [Pseudomonadota bacterium]
SPSKSPFVGTGRSRNEAANQAAKSIRVSDPIYRNFLNDSKEKILSYYHNECDFIMAEAKKLASQDSFEQAFSLLDQVPRVSKECYKKALDVSAGIYKSRLEYDCEGYLSKAFSRAGDRVELGQTLAQFDIADLLLERTSLTAERNQELLKYEAAKAQYKQAEAKVHQSRADKIGAELDLVEAKLARAEIKAPFNGLIVSGDLSQSIGEPIQTGRELFEIAPSGAFRLILQVDERDISFVKSSQTGRFVLTARPEESHSFEVQRITPVLKAKEGRNYYRVEANLETLSDAFRPGLNGRGRIGAGQATILWIWTRDLVAWVRLKLWAFIP